MQRILVVGPSGSGKSTLARALGEALGIEVVHLDQLHYRANWVEAPPEEFRAAILEAVQRPAWVMDGNYFNLGESAERFAACDAIVFLDFPRRVCMWRVLRRTVRTYGRTRPDLADGCLERIDFAFLRWVWDAPSRRPRILAVLEPFRSTREFTVLRSGREVRRFLAEVRRGQEVRPVGARA